MKFRYQINNSSTAFTPSKKSILFTSSKKLVIQQTNEILESVGLTEKRGRITALLSHGDRKVLEIAMALGGKPEFLILDEPTAGMAPEETVR